MSEEIKRNATFIKRAIEAVDELINHVEEKPPKTSADSDTIKRKLRSIKDELARTDLKRIDEIFENYSQLKKLIEDYEKQVKK